MRLADALNGLPVRQRTTTSKDRFVESTNPGCVCHLGYPVSVIILRGCEEIFEFEARLQDTLLAQYLLLAS
jgi:hypothetical protein